MPRPGGPAGAGAKGAPRPGTGAAGAAGGARVASGARPTAGQLNNFLDVPGPAAGAGAGQARTGGAAADFLQGGVATQRPAAGTSNRTLVAGAAGTAGVGAAAAVANRTSRDAGRAGTPGENLAQNRPGRIENRQQSQQNRQQRRDEVRTQYEANNPGNFWEENPGWTAWAVTRPFAWATWGSVGSWCGYSEQPSAYGYGEDVYYSGDQVYYGDQPVATAEEYAQQAETIATSAPETPAEKAEWLPLGVFAITQDGEASGTQPSIYMQLAISKQAAITGTMKNTITGKTQPLEGMADKQSQRVAWAVVGQERPIAETGLSNLTQDAAPALIHFADGQTQQWLMVRIPEPKQ